MEGGTKKHLRMDGKTETWMASLGFVWVGPNHQLARGMALRMGDDEGDWEETTTTKKQSHLNKRIAQADPSPVLAVSKPSVAQRTNIFWQFSPQCPRPSEFFGSVVRTFWACSHCAVELKVHHLKKSTQKQKII